MEALREYKKEMITGAVIAILLYFFLKYVFPLISPFLLAFLTIYSLYPILYKVQQRFKISKTITAVVILLLAVSLIFMLLGLIIYLTGGNITSLFLGMQEWKDDALHTLHCGTVFLEERMGIDGRNVENFLTQQLNHGIESFNESIVPDMMKNSVAYVKKVLPALAFVGIYLIATILFAKDFDGMMEKVHKIGALDAFMTGMEGILHTIGTYMKAQLTILLIVSVICCVGLKLSGISYPFLLGILAGIMDALPFIGTGIVLVPTAFFQLMEGDILQAVLCIVIYVLCIAAREFAEPKLIGKKLGIYPVILLFSIFAGVKLFGVFGIIKGPFAVVLFKQIFQAFIVDKSKKTAI